VKIGWLCIFGAGISLLAGLLAGHFVRPRRRRRRRESNVEAFIREELPGFIPFAIIAAGLLVIGVVILRIRGR
jgi:formate-dependent nitrite reductase membrane component NrfD